MNHSYYPETAFSTSISDRSFTIRVIGVWCYQLKQHVLSVNTEAVPGAYTIVFVSSVSASLVWRLQFAGYLTDTGKKISRQQQLPTELTVSGIDSPSCDYGSKFCGSPKNPNSQFICFHFLAGESYSSFSCLGSDSINVEAHCWEQGEGCLLDTAPPPRSLRLRERARGWIFLSLRVFCFGLTQLHWQWVQILQILNPHLPPQCGIPVLICCELLLDFIC